MNFKEIDDALAAHDLKRAEIVIARQLRGSPTALERADLLYRRAHARLMDARPDDALEDLQTCLAIHPTYVDRADFQLLLGDTYFARFELARVGFAERHDTEMAFHYYHLLTHQKHFDRLGWVYYQMGRIKLSQNCSDEGVHYFQQALAMPCNPADVHALVYERLGFVELFERRNPHQALVYFSQAIKVYPARSNPAWLIQLHVRMSRAHIELNAYPEALDHARRALREAEQIATIQQILPEAYLAIADVLSAMPDQEADAIEHYVKFLQLSDRPPGIDVTWSRAYETIGHLSLRLQRYQQAINAFEKALEINPYHPWENNLYYLMARCYYRLRLFDRTLSIIQQLYEKLAADNSPLTDWRLANLQGNAHFALAQYTKAAEAYRQVIQLAKTDAPAKTYLYLRFAEELSRSDE